MRTDFRDEDLSRQRVRRSVSIGNGLILAVSGVLAIVIFGGMTIEDLFRNGNWNVLLAWQLWVLLGLFVALSAVGVAMFLYGRRLVVTPNPSIPTRNTLPPDHPIRRLPLWNRQLQSLATTLGWLGGSALSIWLAFGPLRSAGEWPRFVLVFVVPGILMIASSVAHAALTGERKWPAA